MQMQVYTVRDSAISAFVNPFYARTHEEAMRTCAQAISDKKSAMGTHPENFDLYYLGTYEDNTGKISPLDTPEHIKKFVELQAQ